MRKTRNGERKNKGRNGRKRNEDQRYKKNVICQGVQKEEIRRRSMNIKFEDVATECRRKE